VERRITQLEIERQALSEGDDRRAQERLERRGGRRSPNCASAPGMKAQWQAEKAAIGQIREMKERLDGLRWRPSAPPAPAT
jgi:ATP-dependent Clp protease ATP-binding subunit ClpB